MPPPQDPALPGLGEPSPPRRGHSLSPDPCGAWGGGGPRARLARLLPEALSPPLTDLVSVPHPRQGIEQLRGQQRGDALQHHHDLRGWSRGAWPRRKGRGLDGRGGAGRGARPGGGEGPPAAPRRAGRKEGCGSPALVGCQHVPAGRCPPPQRRTPRPLRVPRCVRVLAPGPVPAGCAAGSLPKMVAHQLPSRSAVGTPPLRDGFSSLPLNRVDLHDFFNPNDVLEMVLLR